MTMVATTSVGSREPATGLVSRQLGPLTIVEKCIVEGIVILQGHDRIAEKDRPTVLH